MTATLMTAPSWATREVVSSSDEIDLGFSFLFLFFSFFLFSFRHPHFVRRHDFASLVASPTYSNFIIMYGRKDERSEVMTTNEVRMSEKKEKRKKEKKASEI